MIFLIYTGVLHNRLIKYHQAPWIRLSCRGLRETKIRQWELTLSLLAARFRIRQTLTCSLLNLPLFKERKVRLISILFVLETFPI